MRDIQLAREKQDMQRTSLADTLELLGENESCDLLVNLISETSTRIELYITATERQRAPFFKLTKGLSVDEVAAIGVKSVVGYLSQSGESSVVSVAAVAGAGLLLANERAEDVHSADESILKLKVAAGIKLVDLVLLALPKLFRVSLKRESKTKTTHMISPTKAFEKMVEDNHAMFNIIRPRMMPMVHKPDGWAAMSGGGYLSKQAKKFKPLVKRLPDHIEPRGDTLYSGLNQIQNTPYRVNKFIFGVCTQLKGIRPKELEKVFMVEKGEFDEPCPVDREADAYLWEKVEGVKVNKKTGKETVTDVMVHQDDDSVAKRKAFFRWKDKKNLHLKEVEGKKSLDRSYQTMLDVVEEVQHFDELFWPPSLDTRCRVYPSAMTGINLQGSDFQKAVVEFAVSLPIGSADGVYAIQKAVCNHWGKDSGDGVKTDKLRRGKGAEWVERETQWMRECVLDPINNKEWMSASKPFQFLVAIKEWVDWLSYKESHGEGDFDFLHRLCDQNDASCSGAQILSAITLDEIGAMHTNLLDGDVQDLYMACAAEVIRSLIETFDQPLSQDWLGRVDIIGAINRVLADEQEDILSNTSQDIIRELGATGVDVEDIFLSVYLRLSEVEQHRYCLVIRDLVKKPVMVKFYSGTRYGNIKHCGERIVKWGWEDMFRDGDVSPSTLMGGLIYDSINNVIRGAGLVMEYFVYVAGVLGSYNLPVKWETPIGFHVTMSKPKEKALLLRVPFGASGEIKKFTVLVPKLVKDHKGRLIPELDIAKMKSGVAPDIVHSFDASVIVSVSARCKTEGIDNLWMVHDSLGAHCCHSVLFNRIIREEFISLFGGPVLQNLYLGFRSQLETHLVDVFGDDFHVDMLGELMSPEEFGIKRGKWNPDEMLNSEFCFK